MEEDYKPVNPSDPEQGTGNNWQQYSDPPRKPKPCEVFDTIGGIGAGAWLAILLGPSAWTSPHVYQSGIR